MEWAVVLIIVTVLLTAIIIGVLPRVLLRTHYTVPRITDNGVKRIKDKRGRSIVYRPDFRNRKFIEQYILTNRDDVNKLVIKIAPDIYRFEYDVVIYDCLDTILDVIHVDESIKTEGITSELTLPEGTAYVAVLPYAVNFVKQKITCGARIPRRNIVLFALLTCAITFGEIIFGKYCLSHMLAGIYYESVVTSQSDMIVLFIVAGVICVINFLSTLVILRRKNKPIRR
ncbi:MAG: hypothetical protein J1F33_07960 [Clostridiales bacterium]|nr:hypothetical protein [Clostridiales bacterium]